jgi:GNAT superfamily N-acetyltransferase
MSASEELTVEPADVYGPDAVRLITRLSAELAWMYDYEDDGIGDFRPEDVAGPRSGFFVARMGGEAIGCGAFRPLNGEVAEVKRMYVEPAFRGRGISRRILAELESAARRAGYKTVRLETGTRQPEALRLYETSGYRRIENYGFYKDDPRSVCFEKALG